MFVAPHEAEALIVKLETLIVGAIKSLTTTI